MRKFMILFLLVMTPSVAWSDEHTDNAAKFDQVFNSVDTNHSGALSKTEVQFKAPALAENFDKIDVDHDGGLSKKEVKDFLDALDRQRQFLQNLAKADKNNNGKLSRVEAQSLPNISANFDAIDKNHDGQLTLKEIADYVRAVGNSASQAEIPAQNIVEPLVKLQQSGQIAP
jgi:Ca2+-binding EF-hand superfamily protein